MQYRKLWATHLFVVDRQTISEQWVSIFVDSTSRSWSLFDSVGDRRCLHREWEIIGHCLLSHDPWGTPQKDCHRCSCTCPGYKIVIAGFGLQLCGESSLCMALGRAKGRCRPNGKKSEQCWGVFHPALWYEEKTEWSNPKKKTLMRHTVSDVTSTVISDSPPSTKKDSFIGCVTFVQSLTSDLHASLTFSTQYTPTSMRTWYEYTRSTKYKRNICA